MKFLKIKKSISSFLTQEEGGITKKALIGLGIALSGIAIQTAQARHSSSTNIWYDKPNVIARHSSHADHHSCSCQNVCKGHCATQGCNPVQLQCGVVTVSCSYQESCKKLQSCPIDCSDVCECQIVRKACTSQCSDHTTCSYQTTCKSYDGCTSHGNCPGVVK